MADEKVTIKYETEYDGKGAKTAAADAQKVADTAKSAGVAAKKAGAEGQTGFAAMAAGAAKVGAALVAAKGVVDFFAQSVREYQEHARNVNMLAAAFDNVGYTASGAMQQALAFADEMERSTGLDGELFIKGQRALANYGVVGAQAQEAIRAAFALSANQGMAFESALQLLTRAAAGSTATLTRYGVVLGDNVKEGQEFEAAVKQINEQFGPSAQAAMGDTTAKMGALREAWGGFKEAIGQGLNEGLAPVVDWLTDAVLFLQKAFVAGGNSYDWFLGIIQTGTAGARAVILNFADVALKAFGKIVEIGNKLHLIPDGVAEAVKSAEEWISQAADNAEQQTATLNRMRRGITEIWPEEQKITEEQNKQLELQAQQINAARQKKQQAQGEASAQGEVTNELERQQKILDNLGLSSSKDLKGWNRNADNSEPGPTGAEIFAGGDSELGGAADAVAQYDAEAERLEELRELKLSYIEQEISDETLKQEALANLEAQYNQQKLENDKKQAKARQQVYGTMWSALTGLASSENKKVATIGKVASIAQATMSMFTGAAKALELPFPANLAAVATVLAQGAALVQQIEAVKLANGGLVRAVTGGVNAVIGEGGSDEAVLPLDNTQAMRRIGGAIAEESDGLGGGVVVNVNINASGGLQPFLEQLTEATQNGVTEALRYANVAVKAGNAQGGLTV